MKKRFLSTGILFMALVAMLGAMGLGYALWSKALTIDGTVNTGNVDAEFTDAFTDDDNIVDDDTKDIGDTGSCVNDPDTSCDPDASGKNVPRKDKDVGQCFANLVSDPVTGQMDTLVVTIQNGYPSYYCTTFFDIHNKGSIPVKIKSIVLKDMEHDVASGQIKPAPGQSAELVVSTVYDVDLDGDTEADINLHVTQLEKQQLEQSETVQGDLDIHVKQEAPQNAGGVDGPAALTFSGEIVLAQWNEVP